MAKATWREVGKVFLENNDEATEKNRQPNFKGTINVEAIPEGTELIMSGWIYKKDSKIEGISISLSYREVSEMVGRLKKGLKDPTNDKDRLPF